MSYMTMMSGDLDRMEQEAIDNDNYRELRSGAGGGNGDEDEDEDEVEAIREAQAYAEAESEAESQDGVTVVDEDEPAEAAALGANAHPLDAVGKTLVLDLGVEELLLDPALHAIRDWGGKVPSKHEMTLEQLAESILENGQLQRCLAYQTPEGYTLYIGGRRRAAVELLVAEGYKWPGTDEPWKVRVEVDTELTRDEALRRCCIENIHREDFTNAEYARAIKLVRETHEWTGPAGTPKVAEYLGVVPATIMNVEIVEKAPEFIREKVAAGTMSRSAAADLLRTKKDGKPLTEAQLKQVAEVTQELAEKDVAEGKRQRGRGAAVQAQPAAPTPTTPTPPPVKSATPTPAPEPEEKPLGPKPKSSAAQKEWMKEQQKRHKERLAREKEQKQEAKRQKAEAKERAAAEAKKAAAQAAKPVATSTHVRAALKKLDLTDKPKTPKLPEILEHFEGLETSPTYPEVMQRAFGYFGKWAHGEEKATERGMIAAWDDIADAISAATPKTSKGAGVTSVNIAAAEKFPPYEGDKIVVTGGQGAGIEVTVAGETDTPASSLSPKSSAKSSRKPATTPKPTKAGSKPPAAAKPATEAQGKKGEKGEKGAKGAGKPSAAKKEGKK